MPNQYNEEDSGWFKFNNDDRKTLSIFSVQEKMIENKKKNQKISGMWQM